MRYIPLSDPIRAEKGEVQCRVTAEHVADGTFLKEPFRTSCCLYEGETGGHLWRRQRECTVYESAVRCAFVFN